MAMNMPKILPTYNIINVLKKLRQRDLIKDMYRTISQSTRVQELINMDHQKSKDYRDHHPH